MFNPLPPCASNSLNRFQTIDQFTILGFSMGINNLRFRSLIKRLGVDEVRTW